VAAGNDGASGATGAGGPGSGGAASGGVNGSGGAAGGGSVGGSGGGSAGGGYAGSGGAAGGGAAGGGAGATGAAGGSAGGKANFASDVGVTKDTITLGDINMSSATASLGPAIAEPTEKVVEALVHYTNTHGGVSGRQLKLLTCDDGGDVSRAIACYQQLKSKVFAFVPSETWVTDTIHSQLDADKVPWLSWGWFLSEYQDPWMFPCHSNGIAEANAAANWVVNNIHPKRVGIMYLNVSEDQAAKNEATNVLASHGVQVVQTIAQEWDSTDETPHVLAMRGANVDFIFSFSWPTPFAKFVHDAALQNWAPSLGFIANHLMGDPGYGSIFGDYIKNRVYGITSWLEPGDPQVASDPNMQLFQKIPESFYGPSMLGYKWKYAMGHHITKSAWNCTEVLNQAMGMLGGNLTRAGLKQLLDTHDWGSFMGVDLTFHGYPTGNNYPFAKEYIYKWIDGGGPGLYNISRMTPDPVYQGKVNNGGLPVG
jgi:ABC-type branched-subunit amino acid transport system substrate-binding protein